MRRAVWATAGLAIVAGTLGLCGTPGAWAATSHVSNDSQWTLEVNPGTCEVDTFLANGTFSAPTSGGDSGTWSGGGATVKMKWTSGTDSGLKFKGTWSRTPSKEYGGTFGGIGTGQAGQLVKGDVPTFGGANCEPPPSGLTWNSPSQITAHGPLSVSSIDPCPSTLPNGSPINGTVYSGVFIANGNPPSGGWGDGSPVGSGGSWSDTYTDGMPAGTWTITATCSVEQTNQVIAVYAPHQIEIN